MPNGTNTTLSPQLLNAAAESSPVSTWCHVHVKDVPPHAFDQNVVPYTIAAFGTLLVSKHYQSLSVTSRN